MDADCLGGLIELREKYISGTWSPEEEKKFWVLYHTFEFQIGIPLASVIWRKRYRFRIALLCGLAGLAALFSVMYKQMDWADLQGPVGQIHDINKYLSEKEPRYYELRSKTYPTPEAPKGVITEDEGKELSSLETQIDQKRATLEAQYKLLEIMSLDTECGKLGTTAVNDPAVNDPAVRAFHELQTRNACVLSVVQSSIDKLSLYWLPVLYGLLGTLAYMLRSISGQVQRETLNETSLLEASVRIPLGMLAGLAVGLFDPKTVTGVEAITPLALAFVAGYSIELVFSAMDRIVGAFSTSPGSPTTTAAAASSGSATAVRTPPPQSPPAQPTAGITG
jgi:hypothetical protein